MDRGSRKLADSAKSGRLVFLTGAGISHSWPSALPLAWHISSAITDLILETADLPHSYQAIGSSFRSRIKNVPMELLWESLAEGLGERVLDALRVLDVADPNRDHFAIATMLEGANVLVATLNFDLLHEKALERVQRRKPNSIASLEDFQRFLMEAKKGFRSSQVLHLHGSLSDFNSLVSTVGAVGIGFQGHKKEAVRYLLDRYDFFCAGYSDNDSDLLPLLREIKGTLFWYQYSGDLPRGIRYLQKKLADRFIVLRRQKNEVGFADKLILLNSRVQTKVSQYVPETPNEEEYRRLLSQKVFEIKEYVHSSLPRAISAKKAMSRFVIAKLLDEVGERESTLKIIELIGAERRHTNKFSYQVYMREGHAWERIGDLDALENAVTAYRSAAKLKVQPLQVLLAELALCSATLGVWKRAPYRVTKFLSWYLTIRRLGSSEYLPIRQRALWEIGDCLHFISEYILVPSALVIYALRGKAMALKLNRWLATTDRVVILVIGRLRNDLLGRAFLAYSESVRSLRNTQRDEVPAFTALGLIRMVEVLAALGKHRSAKFFAKNFLSKGHALFSWAKSPHGRGVANCAEGIRHFYAGSSASATKLLQRAYRLFGSHLAGQIKTKVFLFRANFW